MEIFKKGTKDSERLLEAVEGVLKALKGSYDVGEKLKTSVEEIQKKINKKPKPIEVYSGGASPNNKIDNPQAIKNSADPRAPNGRKRLACAVDVCTNTQRPTHLQQQYHQHSIYHLVCRRQPHKQNRNQSR